MAWPNGQTRRVKLTIQNGKVAETLTDYPCLITRANLPNEMCSPTDSNRAQSDGGDIRAASDANCSTQLCIEVVNWEYDTSDGAGDAQIEIWVKVSSVSSSVDTDFYLAYNTSGTTSADAVTATYGRNNVWADYEAVWHFTEGQTTSSEAYIDATGNGYNGTATGMAGSAASIVSWSPSATYFAAGDECIAAEPGSVKLGTALRTADLATIQAIYEYPSGQGQAEEPIREGTGITPRIALRIDDKGATTGYGHKFDQETGTDMDVKEQGTLVTDNPTYHSAVYGASGDLLYVNGVKLAENTQTTTTLRDSVLSWYQWYDEGAGAMAGYMEEQRVAALARSENWLSSEYNNWSDSATFIVEGAPESTSGVGGGVKPPSGLMLLGVGARKFDLTEPRWPSRRRRRDQIGESNGR